MSNGLIFLVISAIIGIYVGILTQKPVSDLTDSMKCPFCYGSDLCQEIKDRRITLTFGNFRDIFYNLFSVKNVYFATFKNAKVVLKKLGHNAELKVDKSLHVDEVISKFMNNGNAENVSNFKPCSAGALKSFIKSVSTRYSFNEISTILQINVEPLILTLLEAGDWPVPKLYGSCGSLIVEEYSGLSLNEFQFSTWEIRAFLALQLIMAAIDFTNKHDDFRLYLTDISPDNIAVDETFKLYFVDLENVILKQKQDKDQAEHHSKDFADDDFIYKEEEVCQGSLSDHNVYTVCRFLLSKRSPWPMMPNGLLHNPSPKVIKKYPELFVLVEECVAEMDRFIIAEKLIAILRNISYENEFTSR